MPTGGAVLIPTGGAVLMPTGGAVLTPMRAVGVLRMAKGWSGTSAPTTWSGA